MVHGGEEGPLHGRGHEGPQAPSHHHRRHALPAAPTLAFSAFFSIAVVDAWAVVLLVAFSWLALAHTVIGSSRYRKQRMRVELPYRRQISSSSVAIVAIDFSFIVSDAGASPRRHTAPNAQERNVHVQVRLDRE